MTNLLFTGKDQGVNVRHKVTDMIEFIQDDDRLREARKKAKKNKDKYVGMSSDSMGMRSRGIGSFDSGRGSTGGGWRDSDFGGGGGGGGSRWNSNPSGFRDHSDDDGSRGASPEVSEFRDDDHEYSPPAGQQNVKKFSDTVTESKVQAAPKVTQPVSGSTNKISTKPKKTIDLGAAAAFASASASAPSEKPKPQSNIDLFGTSDQDPVQQQPPSKSSVNLFDDGNDDLGEDDFNPRSSADHTTNANGDFGNFEAAFGDNSTNNVTTGNGGTDSFADFSSAFGSSGNNGGPTSLPAPPTPPPAAASNLDLMGGGPSNTSGPSGASRSNLDLLGGLMMSDPVGAPSGLGGPPPLIGMSGGPTSLPPMMGGPVQQQSLFNQAMPVMGGNPLMAATPNANKSNNNQAFNKKSTLWDNVGNVNIDLDNLSLGGKSQKKPGLPMNALATPNSSPQKVPGGLGGVGAPPPLKSVQSSGSQQNFDLNNLLN